MGGDPRGWSDAELFAAVLPYIAEHWDEGPDDEGWQSTGLEALVAEVRRRASTPGDPLPPADEVADGLGGGGVAVLGEDRELALVAGVAGD